MNLYTVDVLLATCNGSKYIEEQILSIASQVGVEVNLIVSDDGSTDNTLDLVLKHNLKFKSLIITSGPGMGPAQNFFYLLKLSKSDFVAFSDQDDIWLPHHLINSIKRIQPHSTTSAMTFCDTSYLTENCISASSWPNLKRDLSFTNVVSENYARGCTIVLNSNARNLVCNYNSSAAIMHDWWCLLILMGCGTVIYENSVEVLYRIHDSNFIGVGGKNLFAKLRFIRTRLWRPKQQFLAFAETFCLEISTNLIQDIKKLSRGLEGNIWDRFTCLVLNKNRFRKNLWDETLIRLGFLLRIR